MYQYITQELRKGWMGLAVYWILLKITGDYWRLLEITGDYYRLLEITRDY